MEQANVMLAGYDRKQKIYVKQLLVSMFLRITLDCRPYKQACGLSGGTTYGRIRRSDIHVKMAKTRRHIKQASNQSNEARETHVRLGNFSLFNVTPRRTGHRAAEPVAVTVTVNAST